MRLSFHDMFTHLFIDIYWCPGKIAYILDFAYLYRHFKDASVRGACGGLKGQ